MLLSCLPFTQAAIPSLISPSLSYSCVLSHLLSWLVHWPSTATTLLTCGSSSWLRGSPWFLLCIRSLPFLPNVSTFAFCQCPDLFSSWTWGTNYSVVPCQMGGQSRRIASSACANSACRCSDWAYATCCRVFLELEFPSSIHIKYAPMHESRVLREDCKRIDEMDGARCLVVTDRRFVRKSINQTSQLTIVSLT